MFINNPVTASGVWSNPTRTLTVDPATDAGAATLVWTHAARSLTVDPATDAGAATLVWTHAARTLTADPATDAGAATLVWTHASRTLTDPNSGTLAEEVGAVVTINTPAILNSYSAYTTVLAALSHNVRSLLCTVTQTANQTGCQLAFATGGVGAEVDKAFFLHNISLVNDTLTFEIKMDAGQFPKNARLSVRARNVTNGNAVTLIICVNMIEDNA